MSKVVHLLNDFDKVSSKQWKQKIQVDLKGEDYQTLITKTIEKIDIKPFYHYDDFKNFEQIVPQQFEIVQELFLHHEKTANHIARKALNKGASYFSFVFDKKFNIDELINDLQFDRIIFKAQMLDTEFLWNLFQKTEGKSSIFIDPIGHFARYGNWFENEPKDFKKIQEFQQKIPSDYRFILIDTSIYKNSGASIVQEIAYGLSQAVDYIENLNKNTALQISFNFATGSNYFFEIAKLKAFRVLWKLILNEYNLQDNAIIYAQPTLRNKTIFDPYVNMLRTTMEMMSSILGGADFISNIPYDFIYKKSNEFSERIARNQLIILQKESAFNQAINATEGNYYIEEISAKIAEKSLSVFKQIESGGGFLKQLYEEKIQQKISETAQMEQKQFNEGKIVLTGINKYINENEKIDKIEKYPFLKKRNYKTLIQPIVPKRLAEEIEKKRLKDLKISF